jgi:hypothetical protein
MSMDDNHGVGLEDWSQLELQARGHLQKKAKRSADVREHNEGSLSPAAKFELEEELHRKTSK